MIEKKQNRRREDIEGVPLQNNVKESFNRLAIYQENIDLKQEIAQLRRERDQAIREATVDQLSDLLNPRGLGKAISIFEKEVQSGESVGGVVLAMDMTRLKSVNDTYGHMAGDKAIKTFSAQLKSQCRECDIVARVGGDEFVVVLTNTTLVDVEERICDLNRELREVKFSIGGEEVSVGVRIGVAVCHKDIDFERAKQLADKREAFVRDYLMPSSHMRTTCHP